MAILTADTFCRAAKALCAFAVLPSRTPRAGRRCVFCCHALGELGRWYCLAKARRIELMAPEDVAACGNYRFM